MDVVVTSGAIRCAKLQSTVNTNKSTPSFLQAGCPSCRPTNDKSTEGKEIQLRTKMEKQKPSTKMHSQYYTVLYCTSTQFCVELL